MQPQGLGRIGELDAGFAQMGDESEVEGLPGIHVQVVVCISDVVDDFVVECIGTDSKEVDAFQSGLRQAVEDVLHDGVDLHELFRRRGCINAQGLDDAAFFHFAVVVDAAAKEVAVGKDEFFSGDSGQPGGFQTNMADGAGEVANSEGIADFKGFVEYDGQGGKQVAQNVLHGQCNRYAANAKAGNQGGDVDTEVGEDEEDNDRPQEQA